MCNIYDCKYAILESKYKGVKGRGQREGLVRSPTIEKIGNYLFFITLRAVSLVINIIVFRRSICLRTCFFLIIPCIILLVRVRDH